MVRMKITKRLGENVPFLATSQLFSLDGEPSNR
jgi:hypothetical protein